MSDSTQFRLRPLIAAIALGLTACGGGSSDSSTAPVAVTPPPVVTPVSTVISGTAAAGAPIIGKVTVKDSLGAQKTVDIEADGSYKIDVAGMAAPFLFRAAGNVGGREVSYVSSATSGDAGKTINITPFTDLIVANIAGMAAAKFFESPDYAKLTPKEIDDARNVLTARLQPMLAALGVSAGFDLLRTAFKADHSAFDAVMDVVKVTVDPETNKAIIKDLVNNTQIEDALNSKTDNTALPTPVTSPTGPVTALVAINKVLADITSLFATSLPAANNAILVNAFTDDILNDGATKATFLSSEHLLSVDNIGIKLINAVIVKLEGTDKIWATLNGKDGNGYVWDDLMLFKKGSDGIWRMAGNRRQAGIHTQAVNDRYMSNNGYVYNRNLEFWVNRSSNNAIQYMTVTGPGLSSTVGLLRSTNNQDEFQVETDNNQFSGNWVRDCNSTPVVNPCVDFSKVPNDAEYTVTYFDHKGGTAFPETYTLIVPRPPMSNADAQANAAAWFLTPNLSQFLPTTYQALANGTSITLAWTNPTDPVFKASRIGFNGGSTQFGIDVNASLTSKILGTWAGNTPTMQPYYWMFSEGPYKRKFNTSMSYPGN
ncbi:MAG: hypothetical protein NTY70_17165 [Burkholderiales bacterium]|nr:hypothetical protein [Burkholderiales bacterium]